VADTCKCMHHDSVDPEKQSGVPLRVEITAEAGVQEFYTTRTRQLRALSKRECRTTGKQIQGSCLYFGQQEMKRRLREQPPQVMSFVQVPDQDEALVGLRPTRHLAFTKVKQIRLPLSHSPLRNQLMCCSWINQRELRETDCETCTYAI
jgi:hypothetical protein